MDREFIDYGALGNIRHLKGASLSSKRLPKNKFYPVVSAGVAKLANKSEADAFLCKAGTLDPRKVKGKILVYVRGVNGRAEKGQHALLAGVVGMILVNDEISGNEIIVDAHLLPAAYVNFTDGQAIFAYLKSTKNPMAYMTSARTELLMRLAHFMASFSSRGPNMVESSLLKPDITAPGISVIVGFSLAVGPTEEEFDTRRTPYNSQSGTSMSCPHVFGTVGLIKAIHPQWSPAAIKSAIMTTARTRDNTRKPMIDSSNLKATPFAYGAGHVRPNGAMDPGLIYDLSEDDYLNFLCARGYRQK